MFRAVIIIIGPRIISFDDADVREEMFTKGQIMQTLLLHFWRAESAGWTAAAAAEPMLERNLAHMEKELGRVMPRYEISGIIEQEFLSM